MSKADLAKFRETFCLASPGSEEEFRSFLEGYDAACAIAVPQIIALRDRLARMEGAQKLREEIAALEKLCDHDCDNEDCVRCFHYPEILEQKRKQLTALTDGGSNG